MRSFLCTISWRIHEEAKYQTTRDTLRRLRRTHDEAFQDTTKAVDKRVHDRHRPTRQSQIVKTTNSRHITWKETKATTKARSCTTSTAYALPHSLGLHDVPIHLVCPRVWAISVQHTTKPISGSLLYSRLGNNRSYRTRCIHILTGRVARRKRVPQFHRSY